MESQRTREETIAIIESYFGAFTSGGKIPPPITSDYAASSPLAGHLEGSSALEYFKLAGTKVESITLHEHIVDGDRVASLLTEVTSEREVDIIAIFGLQGKQVQRADVFYDPRVFAGNQA